MARRADEAGGTVRRRCRRSGGAACVQSASARAQRGAKAQPGGAVRRVRHLAGDRRRQPAGLVGRGREQRARVGMRHARRTRPPSARCSTTRPAYITIVRSTVSLTTPRSCVISSSAMPRIRRQLGDQVEHLRLHRDVERRRRLVGDQQVGAAGERHRDHHALPLPAGKLVRIEVGRSRAAAPARRAPAARARARRRRAARQPLMHAQRLGDLRADGLQRVERRHRLLEHHADAPAAHARTAPRSLARQQVAPVEHDAPGDARARRQQAHDRERGHRLAAAALADQPRTLAARQREGHARQHRHQPARHRQRHRQAFDVEHRGSISAPAAAAGRADPAARRRAG